MELTDKSIEEFAIYLNYCRSLRFEDRPDWQQALRKALDRLKVVSAKFRIDVVQ